MGTAFDQWLARPSSLCLLRRVISAIDHPEIPRAGKLSHHVRRTNHVRQQRWHTTTTSELIREPESKTSVTDSTLRRHQSIRAPTGSRIEVPINSGLSVSSVLGCDDPRHENEVTVALQSNDFPRSQAKTYDWGLVLESLKRKQHRDGFEGVRQVWDGVRERELDLPVTGEDADQLWSTFACAGTTSDGEAQYREFFEGFIDYAKDLKARRGVQSPRLLEFVLGSWVRTKPELVRQWYKKLVPDFDAPRDLLLRLSKDFAASSNPAEARTCFRCLHMLRGERGLYDSYMSRILETHDQPEALQWHRTLRLRGECPSPEYSRTYEIKQIMSQDTAEVSTGTYYTSPEARRSQSRVKLYHDLLHLHQTRMIAPVREVGGVRSSEVSDNFVAKIFATRAFPLDLIVRGMRLFDIETLGPVPLRELGLRATSPEEFRDKLKDLGAYNIRPDRSLYSRLIQRLASDGDGELFRSLLASDQHPEEYENTLTQERLLEMYLAKAEWSNVHITLLALSLLGPTQHARSWNILLQHHILAGEMQSIVRVMQRIQMSGIHLDRRTLNFMRRYFMPVRSRGKLPEQSSVDIRIVKPLQFMTSVCVYAAQKGTRVDEPLWTEILKRHGMTGKWDHLESLVLWLAQSPQWIQSVPGKPRPYGVHRRIFQMAMRRGIITWAFHYAVQRNQLRRPVSRRDTIPYGSKTDAGSAKTEPHKGTESWAQGLRLVKKLHDLGLYVNPLEIRRSFLLLMLPLFGSAPIQTKRMNLLARKRNRLPLGHYVRHANAIWQDQLFDLDPTLLTGHPHAERRLCTLLLDRHQRTIIGRVLRRRHRFRTRPSDPL